MHIDRFWTESEDVPRDVGLPHIERLVQQSLNTLPAQLAQCDVVERNITRNGQPAIKRVCLMSVAYPALREIEDVFSDIRHLDEIGLNFSVGITALIPEIHPTLPCYVHKGWGRVDGYEECRPPDRTSISISLYGEITSGEARLSLNEIATRVFEPKEVEPGKYSGERSFGSSSGPTPEIEVYKVWSGFDMHNAEAFAYRVREIDRGYYITNPGFLVHEETEWIETRYPPATITGSFWRDARNGVYWLHFQITRFVHYDLEIQAERVKNK